MALKRKPVSDTSISSGRGRKRISSSKSRKCSSRKSSPRVSGTQRRVKLHAKGFQKSKDPSCQEYRIPWSSTTVLNRYPLGLNNSDGSCYRNAAYQILMSIPAFVVWLERYHGPALCSLDHCPGCHMRKIYELIYPETPTDSIDFERQGEIIGEVDDFFGDEDDFFKNNGLGLAYMQQDWKKVYNSEGEHEGGHCDLLLEFLFEAMLKRTPATASQGISSLFGFYVEMTIHMNCAKDSSHDYTSPIEKTRHFKIELGVGVDDIFSADVITSLDSWLHTKMIKRINCVNCEVAQTKAETQIFRTFVPSARRNPEVIFLALVWADDCTENNANIRDHIPFPECLDMTKYLTAERREKGERAVYRLSSLSMTQNGAPGVRDAHATAIVRNPTGGWQWCHDHITIKRKDLAKILNHPFLEPYVPVGLTFVKAFGDTTSGDPPGLEQSGGDDAKKHMGREEDGDEMKNLPGSGQHKRFRTASRVSKKEASKRRRS